VSQFDRRAALWVARRFPGSDPVIGSVEFVIDAAAYPEGAYCDLEVAWDDARPDYYRILDQEMPAVERTEIIQHGAWDHNLTVLMRELADMEDV